MTVLTSKLEVDQSMQPYLLKNSPKSYITPTPKGWREAKKVKTDFDWCVYLTISRNPLYLKGCLVYDKVGNYTRVLYMYVLN